MNFSEYQRAAVQTATYPRKQHIYYPALGLAGEAGEIANKLKKSMRGDGPVDRNAVGSEIGDVLWYCAALASDLGLRLEDIAQANIDKLKDRQQRGVIQGSGDSR